MDVVEVLRSGKYGQKSSPLPAVPQIGNTFPASKGTHFLPFYYQSDPFFSSQTFRTNNLQSHTSRPQKKVSAGSQWMLSLQWRSTRFLEWQLTPSGLLCPALWFPAKERYGPVGAKPEEGHKDVQRGEVPLLWRQAERVGVVQPG